jgi:outer membrane beta-barrel protein
MGVIFPIVSLFTRLGGEATACAEADATAPAAAVSASGTAPRTRAESRRARRRGQQQPAPPTAGVPGQPGECVDASLQEQLLAKRKYRLTKNRLYVKSLRHELTLLGGYYVSDLFDSTFALGGSYTFFMSENFGAELSVGWSRLRTTTADAVEESNNFDLALGRQDIVRAFGSLAWSPLYGKLRLIAASIWRYDLYFVAGPGVVVDPVSYGAAGNLGLGVRVFLHQAVALRFDLRDYLYRQELLSERYLVNDLAFTAGVSVFLPPKN